MLFDYEPHSFVPLATVQQGQTFWYHCDQIGAPLELTDAQGRIAWAADYKVWGEAKVWQGLRTGTNGWTDRMELRSEGRAQMPALDQPFRFQGQQFDVETGLHYNRYRYYDPVVGRFVSQDPIGLWGGLNIYFYTPNPVVWIDPLGLARIYKDAPYHGTKDNSIKSRAPTDGQVALDNSVQVKDASLRRVGVDIKNDEVVVMDKTRPYPNGDEEFHGHIRCWCDLHVDQQAALKKTGMVNGKGKIKR